MGESKKCCRCHEVKSIEDFHKGAKRCKPCAKEAVAEWVKKNPEKRKINANRYARKHSRESGINAVKWYWANLERARLVGRLNAHVRRARLRECAGKVTPQEWQELLMKYDNKCLCCGKDGTEAWRGSLTMDHVVPIALGGSNTIENIQPLCSTCNYRKRINVIDYRPVTA